MNRGKILEEAERREVVMLALDLDVARHLSHSLEHREIRGVQRGALTERVSGNEIQCINKNTIK